MKIIAPILVACALVVAAPASAATVSYAQPSLYEDTGDTGGCGHAFMCGTLRTVTVRAAPGERNTVVAQLAVPGDVASDLIVQDSTAVLQIAADEGSKVCTSSDEHTVRCHIDRLNDSGSVAAQAILSLGDGEDAARIEAPLGGRVSGGEGQDGVFAAAKASAVVLDGGAGDDELTGGGGGDRLLGGAGDDRLTGGAGSDDLRGGSGADRLSGGIGADTLRGGPGLDSLFGGAGADVLLARDGAADAILSCGSGRDRAVADRADSQRGCERHK